MPAKEAASLLVGEAIQGGGVLPAEGAASLRRTSGAGRRLCIGVPVGGGPAAHRQGHPRGGVLPAKEAASLLVGEAIQGGGVLPAEGAASLRRTSGAGRRLCIGLKHRSAGGEMPKCLQASVLGQIGNGFVTGPVCVCRGDLV